MMIASSMVVGYSFPKAKSLHFKWLSLGRVSSSLTKWINARLLCSVFDFSAIDSFLLLFSQEIDNRFPNHKFHHKSKSAILECVVAAPTTTMTHEVWKQKKTYFTRCLCTISVFFFLFRLSLGILLFLSKSIMNFK